MVAYTKPYEKYFENTEVKTCEDLIGFCARVSNPSNQTNIDTYQKLVNYLIDHKHWSPLEMVDVILEVQTTRTIGRQILRHASFRFQEFSGRYADASKELGFVTRDARLQDKKNRQSSIHVNDQELIAQYHEKQQYIIEEAKKVYAWATENHIAKELKRDSLPEGLTLSRMYMKGSIRSWLHWIAIRIHPSTQYEHRILAEMAMDQLSIVCPNIFTQSRIDDLSKQYDDSNSDKKIIEKLKQYYPDVYKYLIEE